jgi:hypothetical protein
VVVEPEELAVPDADDVINGIGAAVTPVRERNGGLSDRHVAPVDVGGAGGERVVCHGFLLR